jgi:hypothetical protein
MKLSDKMYLGISSRISRKVEYVSDKRVYKRGGTPLIINFPLFFSPPKEKGIQEVR